jgi:excisionase family DNA binding protein
MASLGNKIVLSADQGRRVVSAEATEILQRSRTDAGGFTGESERSSHREPYVDAKEGAAFLRIHPKTLMRLAREGVVRAYSFSDGVRRHWRFLVSELDTWMRSRVNSNAHPVRSVSPGRRK